MSVNASIVLSGVDVAEQLPYIILVSSAVTEERIVIEDDSMLLNHQLTLHFYTLEESVNTLTDILQIMVSCD